jgi:uncharacterized protein
VAKFVKTPFTVPVHDLMHSPGEERALERDITLPERFGEGLAWVPAGGIIHVDGRFESIHEGILVTADVTTTAEAECGRCLGPFTLDLEVEIQELFAYSLDEAFDYEVHDDHVDLEPLIRDSVVLALPFQPVCQPDCLGLNPETGELKANAPDSDDAQLDPRWAALSKFTASTKTDEPA